MILRSVTRRRPVALAREWVWLRVFVAGLALLFGARATGEAHEIPSSVTVIAYLKPEGNTLRLVARVPLETMRDIQWPLRGPGYLELDKLGTLLQDGAKIWVIDNLKLFENGSALPAPQLRGIRISLPSDRAFENYESAVANVGLAPLPVATDLARQQAMVDLILEVPIASAASRFSIEPTLARLAVRLNTVLRFVPPSGDERVFTYDGDPGLVHLDPNMLQAAGHFIALGFEHILDGIDHLLFVVCLVIPFRRIRPLLVVVTSFTVAHSITMVASALGFAPTALWFPPVVEVLIALSIVYTAFENIVGARIERRWMIAFGFGLIHGFGFSFALRESLQFAGGHLAISLATFNIGVELGQIVVLLASVPLLNWAFRRVVAERMGTIILSALVAHTAWHWMTERGSTLGEYAFTWSAAEWMRVLILFVVGAAVVWYGRPLVRRALGPAAPIGAAADGAAPAGGQP